MTEIKFGSGFLFLCCLILLFCGFETALCSLISVVVHEFFHVAVAALFGGKLTEIRFGFFGIAMKASFSGLTSYRCDMLCALAGPVSNIVLGIVSAIFAKGSLGYIFAGTNLLFGAYNLIPASGLDGGNVCEALFKRYLPVVFAEKLLFVFAVIFSGLIFILGMIVFCRTYNFSLLLFGTILFFKALKNGNRAYIPVEKKALP